MGSSTRKHIPQTIEEKRQSVRSLAIIGGIVVTIDTFIGSLYLIMLDVKGPYDFSVAFTLVLGLPIYLLDVWHGKRIAYGLWTLFLIRWIVRCFAGSTPSLCNPVVWPIGVLLFTAAALLQTSKLLRNN
jgi:hypothetical protein